LAPLAGLALVAVVLYNATSVDRIPPTFQIKLSAVEPNSSLASTLTSIDVVFSEDVKHDTAERALSMSPQVSGSRHWQGDTLIFTPSAKLPLATTFKVLIAPGVQDIAGNSQGKGQVLTFTTIGPPTVVSLVPPANGVSVPVDTSIQITFDRQMDTLKVLDGLTIEPDAPFTATWMGPTLSLVPNNPLAFSTAYTIKLGDPAVDTDGSRLSPFQATFTTVGMGLRVSALIPAPNVAGVSVRGPIAIVFDGPIDPASINDAIHLTPPVNGKVEAVALPDDGNLSASASASASASPSPSPSPTSTSSPPPAGPATNVLVFTPDSPLAAHTTYTATMSSSVRRTDGEGASAETWTFTTGEAPTTAQNQIVFLSDRSGVANVWLMNPDGSNQREVTSELVPVSGFDVTGDGSTIAYAAGGVVKRMAIGGDNVQVMTATGAFEYAPIFTPDGTAVVVARRDATGADQGYWRIPTVSGADPSQVTTDGAPNLGSVSLHGDELTSSPGVPSWAPRAAFSADGNKMLVVRGADDRVELVDMTNANPPLILGLTGNSAPIWDAASSAFYVVATPDQGATWSYFQVTTAGVITRMGAAAGDLAVGVNGGVAFAVSNPDGSTHLAFAVSASSAASGLLTSDPTWSEGAPSFSPDGSLIVFGRFGVHSPTVSDGIWIIGPNGSGLTKLATDGAYPRWLP
jgi:hypothetical protein